MGDQLDDDFDDDNIINNYQNYDEDEGDEVSDDGQSENENHDVVSDIEDEEEDEETKQKKLKKIKRKQKFNEMKLKKKQRIEENFNNDSIPLEDGSILSPEDQYQLCLQHCPPGTDLPFTEDHFCQVSITNSNKKCSFVQGMDVCLPNLRELIKSGPNAAGSPYVVVVCSAAARAADVINLISKDMKCKIGKLFARHFKVQDQVVALRQHFPIVVGTPNRLFKLIEMGALVLSDLKLLLIDMELDMKSYSVLNLPGVYEDFYQFFCCSMMTSEVEHIKVAMVRGNEKEGNEKQKKKEKKKQLPKRVGFNKRKATKNS